MEAKELKRHKFENPVIFKAYFKETNAVDVYCRMWGLKRNVLNSSTKIKLTESSIYYLSRIL